MERYKQFDARTSEQDLVLALQEAGLLTLRMRQALLLAHQTHLLEVRDDGAPYLDRHVYPVAWQALNRYNCALISFEMLEEMVITALLHDVPENSHIYTIDHARQDFGERVANSLNFFD